MYDMETYGAACELSKMRGISVRGVVSCGMAAQMSPVILKIETVPETVNRHFYGHAAHFSGSCEPVSGLNLIKLVV